MVDYLYSRAVVYRSLGIIINQLCARNNTQRIYIVVRAHTAVRGGNRCKFNCFVALGEGISEPVGEPEGEPTTGDKPATPEGKN